PQHGRRIDQVVGHRAALLADRAVVQGQCLLGLAEVEVEQCAVPPDVHLEEVVLAAPCRLARDHPSEPVLGAALHFHHMRHGMVRPAVLWLQGYGAAAAVLGAREVTTLLKTEGVHAKKETSPWYLRRPMRQRPPDAIAQ